MRMETKEELRAEDNEVKIIAKEGFSIEESLLTPYLPVALTLSGDCVCLQSKRLTFAPRNKNTNHISRTLRRQLCSSLFPFCGVDHAGDFPCSSICTTNPVLVWFFAGAGLSLLTEAALKLFPLPSHVPQAVVHLRSDLLALHGKARQHAGSAAMLTVSPVSVRCSGLLVCRQIHIIYISILLGFTGVVQ